jgi:hypothetical protein
MSNYVYYLWAALAADCLAYYIKTGGLYPGAYWAKYYK